MPVTIRYLTDPACTWSWGNEPVVRRLMWEFGDEIEFVWVMGGLARNYGSEYRDSDGDIGAGPDCFADLISHWLDVAARTDMPSDPRVWTRNPIASTYPACQAVKAASEQGSDPGYRYLRRLREGLIVDGRKLDHADALIAEAGPAGLDRDRFEIDLRSHAITEHFAADLDEVRDVPGEARGARKVRETEGHERVAFPSAVFAGRDGPRHGVWGTPDGYDDYRDAAVAAGASPVNEDPAEPLEAIERFGRCATRELEELCQQQRPAVEAELWTLARDSKLKPVPALTGTLWDLA